WVTVRNQEHTRWVNHTYEVELDVATARRLVEQTETARRGYLLTADQAFMAVYGDATQRLGPAISDLQDLTRDNPRQQQAISALRPQLASLAVARERSIALAEAGEVTAAVASFRAETSARRLRDIRQRFEAMGREERRLLAIRDAEQRDSVRTFYVVLAIAGALLLAVAVISLLTILRYTRDLATSRDRLRVLNETLEEQVAERTSDLSRANEEIQRFAYIVSHDLRSPLVNVMGFTAELAAASEPLSALIDRVEERVPEILTKEARLAVREDLPESIGFIRASTQKMDRLINAILRLSREGRRVIAPEPIDIAILADGAVAAMRQVIDDRGAEVTIERPMPPLVSDRLAVEQIMSNLIENATKYLQPGRPGRITVSATPVRDRVMIAVADNGRGIAPVDHQRIFDLFRRSGKQDQPGEGIGLAHVRALAYRLGGTIDVASSLGEGATFRLNLPTTLQKPQDHA
ncbi:MAG: histidine kinase, partial [Sphingomonas sp.]